MQLRLSQRLWTSRPLVNSARPHHASVHNDTQHSSRQQRPHRVGKAAQFLRHHLQLPMHLLGTATAPSSWCHWWHNATCICMMLAYAATAWARCVRGLLQCNVGLAGLTSATKVDTVDKRSRETSPDGVGDYAAPVALIPPPGHSLPAHYIPSGVLLQHNSTGLCNLLDHHAAIFHDSLPWGQL